MRYNMNSWLDTALSRVRFKHDRKAIGTELRAHMEDKAEHLMSSGMDYSQASQAAVEAMGDPVEVGRALDRVHSPWLGRLWLISRALVIVLLLCLLIPLISGRLSGILSAYPLSPSSHQCSPPEGLPVVEALYPGKDPITIDGYTFRVTGAWLVQGERGLDIAVHMTVTNPWPWAEPPYMVGLMAFRDGLGTSLKPEFTIVDTRGGSTGSGAIFQEDILNSYKAWGAWHFEIYVENTDISKGAVLYYPANQALTFHF